MLPPPLSNYFFFGGGGGGGDCPPPSSYAYVSHSMACTFTVISAFMVAEVESTAL